MKQNKISVAIAGAILVSVVGVSAATVKGLSVGAVRDTTTTPAAGDGGARFVVKYRAGSAESRDTRMIESGLKSAVDRAGLGRTLAATKTSAGKGAVSASHLRRMGMEGWSVVKTTRHLDAQEAASFMRELAADPSVEVVELDRLYQRAQTFSPALVPDDQYYSVAQWNFRNPVGGVGAEQAWDIATGEGVVVAVLDTGIVQNHFDLAANVVPGYDMISDRRISRRANDGRVAGGWDVGDWIEANYCVQLGAPSHPADISSWHGSHVAGTVAQETNNGVGLAGLAHGAKVQPVRVLGSCGGFGSDISDGMLWAAGLEVPGLPLNPTPAEILNMSLGSQGPQACSALYQNTINQVNAAGSIIVVAAGNSNANAANYTMSSCNNVISVGATRITGGKASYSNFGARVDLSAPGGGGAVDGNPNGYIWQMINTGTQGPTTDFAPVGFIGTSMASPHVAAVAAMVQGALVEADRDPLNWQQMRDLLVATARPFPVTIPTNTPMGSGIVDPVAALTEALVEPCDPEVEQCEPDATPLVNKVAVNGLSGNAGSEALYAIEVPAGVSGPLSITTSGGSGNVTLLVSFGEEPNVGDADYTSARPGNNESVRVPSTQAGTYYVKLVGTAAFSNVRLLASHN
ncbi:Subtilisin-like serine protease [Luteimonas aestuarii]|uniref:Subtilisin-like serine protease n=1 Tax=Luteimonas aestuarii TaxID=453837 RepID=A0A4R5TN43_9GAMM|nr:S8 family serine peptidase [Luteimonas aestuarii]TDK20620.1 Subtilisin-like serine protease [Luteimonas aestuarii]